jgi:hypothetical protein
VPIVVEGAVWGILCVGTTHDEPLPANGGDRLRDFTECVLDADRVPVSSEHLRQALVHVRRLVRAAADEHDSLLAQACLYRRPVDEAGLDLLLYPDLHHARLGMIRADTLLRDTGRRADAVDVEDAVAVAMPTGVPLPPPDPAGGL